MPIPEFTEHGHLPPGIISTFAEEIAERFGGHGNGYRANVTNHLMSFLDFIEDFAILAYINGSYVTSNPMPGDADIMVLLPKDFSFVTARGLRLRDYQANRGRNSLDIHPFIEGERTNQMQKLLEGWQQTKKDVVQRPKGILLIGFGND